MYASIDFKELSKFKYTKLASFDWFETLYLALIKFDGDEIKSYFKTLLEEVDGNLELAEKLLN